jgi:hypothetical protein
LGTSGNHTTPSDPSRRSRYEGAQDGWFRKAIACDFDQIAVTEKRYELMRFWLLGTWAAARVEKPFYLVNLVRDEAEQSIVKSLSSHFLIKPDRQFLRATWEDIFRFVAVHQSGATESEKLLGYIREKTVGYGSTGNLRLAFSP